MSDIYDDGDYRKKSASGKQNVLLFRNPLGRARPSAYSLPNEDFIYGKTEQNEEEGAREVIQSWQNTEKQRAARTGRDFVTLNRNACIAGHTSASGFSQYRAKNDVRVKLKPPPTGLERRSAPVFRDSSVTFGQKSKSSEGIANLITNQYQRKWINEERARTKKRQKKKANTVAPFHTKASLGHSKKKEAPKKQYKMKQFANVKSSFQKSQEAAAAAAKAASQEVTEEPSTAEPEVVEAAQE